MQTNTSKQTWSLFLCINTISVAQSFQSFSLPCLSPNRIISSLCSILSQALYFLCIAAFMIYSGIISLFLFCNVLSFTFSSTHSHIDTIPQLYLLIKVKSIVLIESEKFDILVIGSSKLTTYRGGPGSAEAQLIY